MDSPEKLATLGTQDTGRRLTKNTTQHRKRKRTTRTSPKNRGWNQLLAKGGQFIASYKTPVMILIQILHRISLQYAPNANERKTETKRTKNEQTLHTNDTKNTRCMNWIHHARTNERNEPNELYGKRSERTHDTRTNDMTVWSHTPLGQLDRENNWYTYVWLSIQNPNNYINI
jgi:hypothetical protein